MSPDQQVLLGTVLAGLVIAAILVVRYWPEWVAMFSRNRARRDAALARLERRASRRS